MKLYDTKAFDDTKCVRKDTLKSHGKDARFRWGPKNLPIQSVLKRKYCKIKTQFKKQSMISCTVNLVRLHKLRSFDNRSKIRILTSIISTDVNKLTTSNDTIYSSGLSSTLEIFSMN